MPCTVDYHAEVDNATYLSNSLLVSLTSLTWKCHNHSRIMWHAAFVLCAIPWGRTLAECGVLVIGFYRESSFYSVHCFASVTTEAYVETTKVCCGTNYIYESFWPTVLLGSITLSWRPSGWIPRQVKTAEGRCVVGPLSQKLTLTPNPDTNPTPKP